MVEGRRFIVMRLYRYCTENCIKAVGTIREVLSSCNIVGKLHRTTVSA